MHLSRFGQLPFRLDGEMQRKLAVQARARRSYRKGKTMRISDFCFIVAALAALGGMTLGIVMGMSQDFTLAPAHAHLNLLGWVTMALYGLYHRGAGRTSGVAGWLQVGTGALGAVLMSGGLGLYLADVLDDRLAPLVILGSLMTVASMLMFLGLVLYDWRKRPVAFETAASSG
jgi:hypothetical protein